MNQTERIGRFEVQERLRSNAFAIIYRGKDPFDGRRVQIKFCVATDESIRRRFLNAAEQAASLRHPNIATVFEFGSGDSKPYLVQEAFSEETLSDLLARREPIEDVLKLYYLMQIGRGLQHAHSRKVLHRELRPAAVMVDRAGEAKLADFGTARLASAFTQLGNGAHRWPAVGWLLPELLLGLDLDVRSDIYGFGALAYEVLTGRPPYLAESLSALVPQILESDAQPVGVYWPECPPELDRIILRCLSRDPGRRFCSMDEVIQEFDQVIPVPPAPDYVEQERTLVIEDMHATTQIDIEDIGLASLEADTDEISISSLQADTDEISISTLQADTDEINMHGVEAEAVGLEATSLELDTDTIALSSVASPQHSESLSAIQKVAVRPQNGVRPGIDWRGIGDSLGHRGLRLAAGLRRTGGMLAGLVRAIDLKSVTHGLKRARWRKAGVVLGALLLSGVVGWSVVRVPDEALVPPTTAPQLPGTATPTAAVLGTLVVDTQPWGEVVRLIDEAGNELSLPDDRYTPVLFALAPGEYIVEVSRPELEEVQACVVEIAADSTSRCEPRIASVEVQDLFRQTGWWQ